MTVILAYAVKLAGLADTLNIETTESVCVSLASIMGWSWAGGGLNIRSTESITAILAYAMKWDRLADTLNIETTASVCVSLASIMRCMAGILNSRKTERVGLVLLVIYY